MTKEIILPIKCSTVKNLNTIIETVFYGVIIIGALIWGAWSIWVCWMLAQYPNHPAFSTIDAVAIAIGTLFAGSAIFIISVLIYENLPTLGCIKDDDTPKQERD